MTAQTMKQTSMKQTSMRLISQIDDKDKETIEKVYLFLTGIVQNKQKPKRELTPEQARKAALVDKYCGAFAASQTEDWKKTKEEYLQEKYGQK